VNLLRTRYKLWFFKRRYVIVDFCPRQPLDFNIGFSLHDLTCHLRFLTLGIYVARTACR